jgi:predicted anti-sigma-YlaC factor YlaD
MTSAKCAAARELAPDLALGLLDGDERARALEHVHHCPSCQGLVAELSGVADLLGALAPEAEPPPDFGARVLDATQWRARRARRRWIATVAAVAAVAVIGAVALVRVIDADRGQPSAAAPELLSSPMRGAGGVRVGRAVSSTGSPASLAVTVDYAVPDGDYELDIRPAGAASAPVTTMTIADGHGEWNGRVGVIETGTQIELVDSDGVVVCHAALRSADAD